MSRACSDLCEARLPAVDAARETWRGNVHAILERLLAPNRAKIDALEAARAPGAK